MSEKSEPGRDAVVSLREITQETLFDVLRLEVSEAQKKFVARNSVSIAEAHFEPQAWFRAIYADETPVGFVMLHDNVDESRYFLWRFMIDERYQGRGYGRLAIEQLVEYVRTRPGATELLVTCVPGEGSPEGFYAKMGFVNTGVKHGEELEMKLTL